MRGRVGRRAPVADSATLTNDVVDELSEVHDHTRLMSLFVYN
jgi:hypothetical protein